MLKKYNVDSQQIQLEITEYSIIENISDAAIIMGNIKNLGFKIALDDFGTKYSSLNYISKLPFDTLKIDKSYIDKMIEIE